jgi:hypothetical protein
MKRDVQMQVWLLSKRSWTRTYLRAPSALRDACELAEQAIKLDAQSSSAHEALAAALVRQVFMRTIGRQEVKRAFQAKGTRQMRRAFKQFKNSADLDVTVNGLLVRLAQSMTEETTTLYFGE